MSQVSIELISSTPSYRSHLVGSYQPGFNLYSLKAIARNEIGLMTERIIFFTTNSERSKFGSQGGMWTHSSLHALLESYNFTSNFAKSTSQNFFTFTTPSFTSDEIQEASHIFQQF
jgi:hypothetical protein